MNLMPRKPSNVLVICLLFSLTSTASGKGKEMQKFNDFQMDRTEVTIGDFRKFVEATKFRSRAEVEGGGFEYGAGWERRPGWTWQRPHGVTANDQEPAVHLNYAEAQAYCEWVGKRLPNDEEWASAAYQEQRRSPPAGFEFGKIPCKCGEGSAWRGGLGVGCGTGWEHLREKTRCRNNGPWGRRLNAAEKKREEQETRLCLHTARGQNENKSELRGGRGGGTGNQYRRVEKAACGQVRLCTA